MVSINKEEIIDQLRKIDEAIEEVKKRMPAHSVKPPVMHELLDLEDERDIILKKLENNSN
jgi:hypothetical protein